MAEFMAYDVYQSKMYELFNVRFEVCDVGYARFEIACEWPIALVIPVVIKQ